MIMRFGISRSVVAALGAVLMVSGVGCDDSAATEEPEGEDGPLLRLQTLSNRADMISGGDALVQILLPPDTTADGLRVRVGERDVTSAFAPLPDGRIVGLVTGLANGPNKLSADLGGKSAASLPITNHPIGGPVFSGAQATPFFCATPDGRVQPNGVDTNPSGLRTEAIDAQCNIATERELYYRTKLAIGGAGGCVNIRPDTAPAGAETCFKRYTASVPDADVASTTTDTGVTVPYIVRVERGTLNRGIFDIAVLFDPKAADVEAGWKPTAPQPGWNGKVLYSFGASTGQPRRQFRSAQSWTDDAALSRGFMVAVNSMTDSALNSNRTTMTETIMMMKERIIDTYGEIRYVMGVGCSGGSINQLTAASIFPGLLDGIQPSCTYPDSETTGVEVVDCTLLVNAYQHPAWKALQEGVPQDQINAKKAAINGHIDFRGCHAWVNSFSNVGRPGVFRPILVIDDAGTLAATGNPTNNCQLPNEMVYDQVNNPTGIRCSGADYAASIFGKVPNELTAVTTDTRARTTNDNTGVQYGLKALLAGAITAEEFVTLNEVVGGLDADANVRAQRSVGDADALAIAYRAGIISDAKQLAKTAIIDLRGWDDSGIHHQWRSFALRDRLQKANGGIKNHAMWRYGNALLPAPANLGLQSFLMMDEWLTKAKANTTDATIELKVANTRPAATADFCFLSSDTTFQTKVTNMAMCDADDRLKPRTSPRQVAGGPLSENVMKCQLKPFSAADYPAETFTPAQVTRLMAVFKDGVCDFSKPGVGQQAAVSPLSFAAGPGGIPFPNPPSTKGP